jgi:hypothetical protein
MSYTINLIQKNNAGTITTTNISSKVLNGFGFVEKLDESLDVGTMIVRGLTTSTPYSMFDVIEMKYNTTIIFSLRIGGDSVSLISKNPLLYEHTLSLVEHTKILERFIISGKTFTQPTSGTPRYYIYDVIENLINTTPLETSANLATTRLFTLPSSGDLYDLITTTPSPEFTFKDVTFREALNQVCGYIDGIPRLVRLTDGTLELSVDFVNELKELITSENVFIDKKVSQDIGLYGTNIESEALNLVNDALISESVEIYPSENGFITARCDEYIFDFTKSFIPTPKRIYSIQKLFARIDLLILWPGATGDPARTYYNDWINVDLAKIYSPITQGRVLENNSYKKLDVEDGVNSNARLDETNFYQSNTIYYNYREKNITHSNTIGLWDIDTSLEYLLKIKVYEQLVDEGLTVGGILLSNYDLDELQITISGSVDDYLYQVHYTPIPNSMRLNIDRTDLSDVDKQSTILSNQQGRIVNLENFTNNLQGKINRIGNSELQLENRINTPLSSFIYDIGDYTSDIYIVTVKEWIFFKDYVYMKYGLSKNYNMISKFIGVNSEIRQWEIGENNTLDRNLIYKEYVEIDAVESGSGSNSSQLMQTVGLTTYIDTFKTTSTYEPVRGGLMVGDDIPSTLLVSLSSNGGGNSLMFNWKFDTNKIVGEFREEIDSQIARNFVSYTDDDGISENFTLYMYDKLTTPISANDYLDRANTYPKSNLTYVTNTLLKNNTRLQMYKDSREVIGGTIHLQIKSADIDKIVLGRWLSMRNRLVSENPPTEIRLYTYSNDFKFGRLHTFDLPSGYDTESSYTASITPSYTNFNIQITDARLTSAIDSYCLTDENDKILLAVNQDGARLDTITFDFLNKASGINYKY